MATGIPRQPSPGLCHRDRRRVIAARADPAGAQPPSAGREAVEKGLARRRELEGLRRHVADLQAHTAQLREHADTAARTTQDLRAALTRLANATPRQRRRVTADLRASGLLP